MRGPSVHDFVAVLSREALARDHTMQAPVPANTPEEKLARATTLKEQGNEAFKKGDWKAAMLAYHQANLFVKGLDTARSGAGLVPSGLGAKPLSPALVEAIAKMELSLNLNLAACHAKTEAWAKVVGDCDRVLAIDGKNVKGLFRRGQARLRMGDTDKAAEDLNAAAKAEPNDAGIKAEIVRLQAAQKVQDDKQRNMFAKMFASSK